MSTLVQTPMQFATNSPFATEFQTSVYGDDRRLVTLIDGRTVAIDRLEVSELEALQQEQEPAFARAIEQTKKDSLERSQTIQRAYASICSILDEIAKRQPVGQVFSMGMDRRYADLVLRLLASQTRKGISGGLFELGCSAGGLLAQACQAGYRVGGLEVVPELLDRTRKQISPEYHQNLFLGDFRAIDLTQHRESYSVAYWNDVFEHIPLDEIAEYLTRLYTLLKPGGLLVTITPNWHMRPSDVTSMCSPPRTQATGFHFKEYTLREIIGMLASTGFGHVQTPSFISRHKIYTQSWLSLTKLKCLLEPRLELLPFSAAVQCCRRFGLSCTIATKPVI